MLTVFVHYLYKVNKINAQWRDLSVHKFHVQNYPAELMTSDNGDYTKRSQENSSQSVWIQYKAFST